jgi:subtilisin family serine protease
MSAMPPILESGNALPRVILGYVSVRSQGGASFLDADDLSAPEPFYGSRDDHGAAERALASSGLEVVAESELGKAVAGPPEAFEELTGGRVEPYEQLMRTRSDRTEYVTHLDIVGDDQPDALGVGSSRAEAIEGVVLERPRAPQSIFPAPIPPCVARFHLRVPDDVATILGAEQAHRRGLVGAGVTVAMVDSGWFRHPFFAAHGYAVRPPITVVPGTNPGSDPHGHGTGESANIFAIAPGATLQPFRAADNAGNLVGAIAGFVRAKQSNPGVLTNSWGGDGPFPPPPAPPAADRALILEIRDAIARGIVVVFSAGNGQFSSEAQVPGVIAAGGVFATAGLDLRASDYASGYHSPWFGGVDVPTVSGLVGMRPRASYIMLPIPSGCPIDVERAAAGTGTGLGDPPDGTTANDGWALFSGTSAAAPQVAGAAAVLRAIKPGATPAQVTQALSATAVDVIVGRCHPRFNNPAAPGRDLATGFGLINVSAAAAAI